MKKKIYKIFHQNDFIVFINIIIIILSMTYLIVYSRFDTPIAYILYFIMTILFITICIKIYDLIHYLLNLAINKNKYFKMYYNDPKLKYKISLFSSLWLNIIYVLFKLISGIIYKSLWLIAFAIYYFILVVLRINIAKIELKKDKSIKDEYLSYRNVGIILLFINLFIIIIVLIIVNGKTLKSYNDIIAISVATYTFYLMINSIINLIKYRKYKSPLMSSAKVINVITSLISMLSLEIIMLSTFCSEKIEFNEIMIMTTGGGICIVIIGIALYMIIKGTDFIKSIGNTK